MPKILKTIGVYLYALIIFVFTVFPFYWVIVSSLRPEEQLYSSSPSLIPTSITLENYVTAFTKFDIGTFFMNSLYVTIIPVILSAIIASLAAYSIARLKFRGKRLIQNFLPMTQMIPIIVLFVPLYMFCREIGLYNSLESLILPYTAIQTPACTLLMINYFASIPSELDESARIDGCSKIQVFLKIFLPLAAPGIAATTIYSFVQVWQEFLLASGMLANQDLYTLTVGLGVFRGQNSTNWGGLMATSVVIALPSLVFFALAQNYFINNMSGGVKE